MGMRDMAGSDFGGVLLYCNGHGEWGQAGDDSWEEGGEEGEAAAGERELGDSATDWGRAAQIGHNWIFIRLLRSVRL